MTELNLVTDVLNDISPICDDNPWLKNISLVERDELLDLRPQENGNNDNFLKFFYDGEVLQNETGRKSVWPLVLQLLPSMPSSFVYVD